VGTALRIAGVLMILVSLQDQFQTLFHPAGRGTLSDWASRAVWQAVRFLARWRLAFLTLGGPLAMLVIIVIWGTLICFGWALLYYPQLDSFIMMPGLNPGQHHSFLDALNISLGSLVTITGDMMPTARVLRFLMATEGVVGIALLTASVSWLLSVYPVLEAGRSFAQETMSLYKARCDSNIDIIELPEIEAQTLIHGVAVQLATVRNQMVQFPVTYYFNVGEAKTGIAVVMPFVCYLAERAERDTRPGVRLSGAVLTNAVDSFVEFVADTFLHVPKTARHSVILALAHDHMRKAIGIDLMLGHTDRREFRPAS